MEGLGLSALTAIILLSPGFAFLLGANRPLQPGIPATFDLLGPQLLLALAVAAVAHSVGLSLVGLSDRYAADVKAALVLLGAGAGQEATRKALAAAADHHGKVFLYFFLQSLLLWLIGNAWRDYVKPLRGWAKFLSAPAIEPKPVAVVVTAQVAVGEQDCWYTGMLEDYEVGQDGQLAWLLLEGAQLRVGTAGDWEDVPGESLMLVARDATAVTLNYWYAKPASADPAVEGAPAEPSAR